MDEATKLFRIYKTCLEMLHDRGYLVLQARRCAALMSSSAHAPRNTRRKRASHTSPLVAEHSVEQMPA